MRCCISFDDVISEVGDPIDSLSSGFNIGFEVPCLSSDDVDDESSVVTFSGTRVDDRRPGTPTALPLFPPLLRFGFCRFLGNETCDVEDSESDRIRFLFFRTPFTGDGDDGFSTMSTF